MLVNVMGKQKQLLEILSDGAFHSGEALGRALGVSRTGIWKIIKVIEGYGIDVHSVHGKGYRLPQRVELLDEKNILSCVDKKVAEQISATDLFLSCDSTNAYLMELGKGKNSDVSSHGRVCMAEMQTNGRGRRGRKWISPFGGNIYLSIGWHFSSDPHVLSNLGLALSVAVIRALKNMGVNDVKLKWPNDVIWQGRKLAGILVEMVAESTGPCRVVIGLGLNLNLHCQSAKDINQPWVDIKQILGHVPPRNVIAGMLLQELVSVINQYEQQGLSCVVDEWRRYDAFNGRSIDLFINQNQVRGKCEGIDNMGALLLRNDNGHIQKFTSGEISMRPV